MKTITVEPHWENLYRWFALALDDATKRKLAKNSEWKKLFAMAKQEGWDKKYAR